MVTAVYYDGVCVIDAFGFSQELMTVWENEGIVNVTIFSYCNVSADSFNDLSLSFMTFNGNATESK